MGWCPTVGDRAMPADPRRAKSIFMAALAADTPAERDAYLAGMCGDDAALRGRVGELLRANDTPGSFLDTPAVAAFADPADRMTAAFQPGDGSTTSPDDPLSAPGSEVGAYKLREVIGEAGWGPSTWPSSSGRSAGLWP